jgi:hypothetical protein
MDLRSVCAGIHARQPARAHRPSSRSQPRQQPPDGSNWELLCLYCHDNEHQRQLEAAGGTPTHSTGAAANLSPFSDLKERLKGKKQGG